MIIFPIVASVISLLVLTVIIVLHLRRWPLRFSLKNIGYYDRNLLLYINSTLVPKENFKIPVGKTIDIEIGDTKNNTINPKTGKNFTRNEITEFSFKMLPAVESDIHCPNTCPTKCPQERVCTVHSHCSNCPNGDCSCTCTKSGDDCCCLPANCPDIEEINKYKNPEIWCIGNNDINDPGFGFKNSIQFISENIPNDITITKTSIANTDTPTEYSTTVFTKDNIPVSAETDGANPKQEIVTNKWPESFKKFAYGEFRPYTGAEKSDTVWNNVGFYNVKLNNGIPFM